ncbi:two-component sensor histidine kinase [Streptomyces sp. WZ.A104]|uniref:sensor histidine kinase n=1 Tax=Streptomyces sp. WZ.A104 TaxID=2023771 RepID=UPI000BBC82AD|nr:sensor histidine kinase [Streptomyces sp. WZ.A104]PCG85778.1 two-component sensor histidine kinase [Streptomyces sp. WZ.A104]
MGAVTSSGAVRLRAAVRRAPRALYEDLWAAPADRVPRMGEPGSPVWRPVFLVLLVIVAVCVTVIRTVELTPHGAAVSALAVLVAAAQSAALVAGMIRPVGAWWAATALAVVAVLVTVAAAPPDHLYPWLKGLPVNPAALYPTPFAAAALQGGALFLLALRVRPRRAVAALALSLATALFVALRTPPLPHVSPAAAALVCTTALVLGTALRSLRLARKDLVVQAELTAEERARRTLLEERNRIARELHDVVAHHMSVISIQAQVAPHLVEDPSDELKENLTGIRENALEALTELRRVLGVLRSEDAPARDASRHAPQPGLDGLDGLLATVRSTGLAVTLTTTGEPRPLPPGVELSAYRIVQEALSNVMRHAPGASARVEIGHRTTGLTVRVTNTPPDRPAAPSPGTRHGLLGMRERTAMLGGDLATGPAPDGGWEVTAVLPTAPTTTATTEDAP